VPGLQEEVTLRKKFQGSLPTARSLCRTEAEEEPKPTAAMMLRRARWPVGNRRAIPPRSSSRRGLFNLAISVHIKDSLFVASGTGIPNLGRSRWGRSSPSQSGVCGIKFLLIDSGGARVLRGCTLSSEEAGRLKKQAVWRSRSIAAM
jgi:hypothetical protein